MKQRVSIKQCSAIMETTKFAPALATSMADIRGCNLLSLKDMTPSALPSVTSQLGPRINKHHLQSKK